jgi:hypothetical protein
MQKLDFSPKVYFAVLSSHSVGKTGLEFKTREKAEKACLAFVT